MKRIVLGLGFVVLAAVGTASGIAGTAKDSFALKGEVYPNYVIEMKTRAGMNLKTIKAGTYRIKIEDKASIHNFHLKGPGVNKATSVRGKVETFWTVKFRPGRYSFFCDPHPAMMRGSFRVTR